MSNICEMSDIQLIMLALYRLLDIKADEFKTHPGWANLIIDELADRSTEVRK